MRSAKAMAAVQHISNLERPTAGVKYFLMQSKIGNSGFLYNFHMVDLGKMLLLLAAVMAVVGLILMFAGRTNLPLGRLPGDILYRGKNTTVFFPIATSILLSVILSVVLYLVGKFRH